MIFIQIESDIEKRCEAMPELEVMNRVLEAIGRNEDYFVAPNAWRVVTGCHEFGGFQVMFVDVHSKIMRCHSEPLFYGGMLDDMTLVNFDTAAEPVAHLLSFSEALWNQRPKS